MVLFSVELFSLVFFWIRLITFRLDTGYRNKEQSEKDGGIAVLHGSSIYSDLCRCLPGIIRYSPLDDARFVRYGKGRRHKSAATLPVANKI
jgi:hypothetical protein